VSPLWKRKPPPAAPVLAQRFDELGLFEHLDSGDRQRAKDAVASKGIDAVWRVELARDVMSNDPEDLAEGGVGEFLQDLREHLARRGVTIAQIEDIFNEERTRYEVKVDDDLHTIYDLEGADADAMESMSRLWGLAWARAFDLVNDLLESAGSHERAYKLPEATVWFLTPEQFEALRSAIENPRDRPYAPNTTAPWYGEEH